MPGNEFETRLHDIQRLYEMLDELEASVSGKRTLERAHGRMNWPERGAYFFFEPGEERTTSGTGLRVVRVGTHALKAGGKSTLLSNYNFQDDPIDPSSSDWLGHRAASEQVRCSGLWNANHVADDYDPIFLDILQEHVLGRTN